MRVREFQLENDYLRVRELWKRSGPGVQLSPSDEKAEILRKLERDPDLFLVLEEQDHIIGAVIGGYDGRRGMVYHLAIDTEFRGRGLGQALMNEIEARLRAKGCYKYYLLIRKNQPDVLTFYESIGCEKMDIDILGKVLG